MGWLRVVLLATLEKLGHQPEGELGLRGAEVWDQVGLSQGIGNRGPMCYSSSVCLGMFWNREAIWPWIVGESSEPVC